jgi:hypothetical protein
LPTVRCKHSNAVWLSTVPTGRYHFCSPLCIDSRPARLAGDTPPTTVARSRFLVGSVGAAHRLCCTDDRQLLVI